MIRIITLFLISGFLTACTTEQNYRGVPEPAWKQLSAEQRQLIVDQSFQQEMSKTS